MAKTATLSDLTTESIARRHLRVGRLREAEMLMEDWSLRQPASASLQVLRGWLCLLAGRNEEGRQLIDHVVHAAPHLAFAYVAKGVLHEGDGALEDATLCWQRALVLDPTDLDAYALLVQSHMKAADAVAAENVARSAIVHCPLAAMAHCMLAETLMMRLDGVDEAIQLAARGVALEPDEWRGWLVYGRALTRAGRLAQARGQFERALLVRPSEPEAMQALAAAYLSEAMWPEAERLAKKIIVISPKQAVGYRVLARAQAAQQRDEEAAAVLAQALRFMPQDPALLMDLARLHRRNGRFEEAIAIARQAQAAASDNPEPSYFIADLDLYRGQPAAAFAAFAALELAKQPVHQRVRLPADIKDTEGRPVILTGDSVAQTILLARYAPQVKDLGSEVYLACAQSMPWGALAECLIGVSARLEVTDGVLPDAFVAPMVCLPTRCGIGEGQPLWSGPYLEMPEHHVTQVRAALADKPRPWIGVELNGKANVALLRAVIDIISQSGGTAVVLGAEMDPEVVGPSALWPSIPDLYLFAVWVKALDTVIAADGLTCSMAGPQGKDVHILLSTECDSLWGGGADRTAWYPSLRLYRESAQYGWLNALNALQEALRISEKQVDAPVHDYVD